MRIWINAKGDLITDDQVLALLEHYGDLGSAAGAGNIKLLNGTREAGISRGFEAARRGHLRDYVEERGRDGGDR